MKKKLTPHHIDLIYDACLKSFWRKGALAKFLRQCGITESFLSSWVPDESKRDFLDRLFYKLIKIDSGISCLLRISDFLIEQESFPDLENWEDSSIKIEKAHNAVLRLRKYHIEQEEELRSEEDKRKAQEEFRKRQEEIKRSKNTLEKLEERLNVLAMSIGTQKAGYDFQDWFFELLDFSEITNRKPYTHEGRQIDGTVTLEGTTYLIELKFTKSQVNVTDIDSFYKKITTKADNTMGIMVSMSGYSTVAKKEASGDKTPILLLDHSHIYYIFRGIMGFSDIIERIRRHASQTGEAYLGINDFTQ